MIRAWKPGVPGVSEVFHAHFVGHAYPPHTHDAWTVLIVDDGAVRFDLDLHHHGIGTPSVTVLPPHVPHDGRSATEAGFRKRVLYVDTSILGADLAGAAVDQPTFFDPALRHRLHQLHLVLARPGDELEAESRLALVRERLCTHLRRRAEPRPVPVHRLAGDLRDLLDEHTVDGLTLERAAEVLHAHPTHLVRSFTRAFGLPPHLYLTGRRVDLARRLLLAGQRPAEVATAAGFYDQAHLGRHFKRHLGVSPGRFTGRRSPASATAATSPPSSSTADGE
ncbi:helix-turn-helix domain-containing protein [Amycolatopsis magusensis]|uniref:AraC-like DNA-binding protein n=1 Tax=Amycolatopsis magusensis TaxID=882444 RepID=A0ABS4PWQ0_9PSEU|nr:AraC family transcriptional regulator [Amycolatopsis magusensis]MBP2183011.1 AraC-like DNA-binding protein [Amycolatopsis magusensis]